MKVSTKKLAIFGFALTILFFSCSKKSSVDPSTHYLVADGSINSPTIWTNDKIKIIKDRLTINSLLKIEPGTIIKLYPEADIWVSSENGSIEAVGTETAPIIFTSIKDDVGGDTNNNIDLSKPIAGDWSGIKVKKDGSHFKYCIFTYGGSDSDYGTLDIDAYSAIIEYCTFKNNLGTCLNKGSIGSLAANRAPSSTIIRNNEFYSNTVPITISAEISIDNSNTFSNPNDKSEKNKYNGLFIQPGMVNENISWTETEVAIVLWGIDILPGATLSLGDNVVLKIEQGLILHTGPEQLINYDGEGVYFTAIADDSLKGDTNGDGTASSPETDKYAWYGIWVAGNESETFSWPNILYTKDL